MRVTPKRHANEGARETVRAQFDPFSLLALDTMNFHGQLPTPELRTAFAAEFPFEFFEIAGLARNAMDPWAGEHADTVFRRWDIAGFLAKYRPAPFDPPDLCGMADEWDADHAMALARARWWIGCKLPVTPSEIQWLRTHLPELATEAGECPSDTWDAAHVPSLDARPEASPEQPGLRLVIQ